MQPLAEVLARLFRANAERCRELGRHYRLAGRAGLAERQELMAQTWDQAAAQAEREGTKENPR